MGENKKRGKDFSKMSGTLSSECYTSNRNTMFYVFAYGEKSSLIGTVSQKPLVSFQKLYFKL